MRSLLSCSTQRCDTTWVLDDGKPVGYVKVNYGTAQTVPGFSDGLEVEQVYVLASHHGQGLGGQLLDLATEKARERGLTYLWLGVWEHNSNAISLYRHRGYEEFDQHVFMFGKEEQRDVLSCVTERTASVVRTAWGRPARRRIVTAMNARLSA